jgi:flagellar hook-basal body complex protein FliE
MALPISAVPSVAPLTFDAPAAGATQSASGSAFRTAFENAVDRVEQFRGTADQLTRQFLAGEGGELHNVVLATQQAELSFEMFQQVRNKVVQAYQEIMRMQL